MPARPAARIAHPVRAQIIRLPANRWLLVGTDILDRSRLASRLRTAMFWGVGASVLLATLFGLSYSRRIRRRVRSGRGDLRIHHGRQSVATTAGRARAR